MTSRNILIVDDEFSNRRLLEALLQPEGYITRTAASGAQALASIAEDPPDLILLDVMMPGMSGHELASIIKSDDALRNIPIIMVTARDDRDARLTGLDAGAEDFLTKPVDRPELWLRVRNLLRLKDLNDILANHRSLLEVEVLERTADLQRFRTAMDSSGDAILLVDRRTMRFSEVNTTACEMLGYSRAELLTLGPVNLQPDALEHLAVLYKTITTNDGTNQSIDLIRRKDGSDLPVEAHRHAHGGEDGVIVCVLRDITERQQANERLHHLAHYDALTGLPNRSLFHDTLEQTLPRALARGWTVAVLFVDLDHFKNVNDTLGHAIGDELLIAVSQRLEGCVRIRDSVGRLGGDEFAIILTMEEGPKGAAVVATNIKEALREPFSLDGHELTVTASIGITTFPDDTLDRDTLIRFADTAMYQAKRAGRDTFRFFTSRMNTEALARLELEIALRQAIKNNEFVLHYQPKVHLGHGGVTGLEALLRWERPGHGLVSPADFIPVLEESGLIVEVGRWVIDTVCEQIGRWIGSAVGPMQVSVNVAGRQFVEGDLEADVTDALHTHGIPPDLLELELTESSLMANTVRTIEILRNLKRRGAQISIDDFGTGYSSLAYLRRFPIDKLKIDRSFICEITSNPDAAAIAITIVRMAHSLNLDVVAEGVETAAQREYLERNHCDQMQGYYFSRPLPVTALEHMLLAGTSLPAPFGGDGSHPATLLLVDQDPLVLEALHLLLAEDGYRILQAETAAEGFELLALHKVQIVVCDPPTGEADGADFLNRVKELHPDVLRIALSGDVDAEALLGTINRGEVYRYYKKPWDDHVLRSSIRDSFRHYWRIRNNASVIESDPTRALPITAVEPAHAGSTPGEHDVILWQSTEEIVTAVADYWVPGLESGEDFLLLATPAHRTAIEELLIERGIDTTGARLVTLDASETLSSLMVDGVVDPERFDVVIGDEVRRLTSDGRRLRVYGDMVGILWNDNAVTEALRLEGLWSELSAEVPVSLLCGYDIAQNGDGYLMSAVCGLHGTTHGDCPAPTPHRRASTSPLSIDAGAGAIAKP